MHESNLGCSCNLFPSPATMIVAGMWIYVGAGIATIVERQSATMADVVRHIVREPEALPGTHKPDHPIHHVMMNVAMKYEVAFEAAECGTWRMVIWVLCLFLEPAPEICTGR
jgi:hypothetical protein